ncbi:Ribosome biogenesis protein NOP53 [Spathaspora sp. JA1]|nr:Ribosome biogenesis protein NOP53 [Spathaspora sp. JA1]
MGETKTKSKPQSSRKGKRAWRKNIDIEEVESGLQASRDSEIVLGKSTNEDEEDFIIDNTPQLKPSIETVKKLKTHEILTNKSKVPALPHAKESKKPKFIQGVKRTDVLKLVKLTGGRYKSESRLLNRIEQDGLTNVSNNDLWGDEEKETTPVDGFSSTAEVTRASVVPKTLSHAPIQIVENDLTTKTVHAGKSYNPSLESWKDLINQEYDLEYKRELARQQIAEHREKIKMLVDTLKDDNFSSDDEDGEVNEEDEHINQEDEGSVRLSINKPTQVKIKTKTKRNKEAKHKKRLELEAQLKDLKKQLKDLSNLDELLKQQQEEEEEAKQQPATKKQRKNQKLFKYNPIQAPLEVKLSNELTNNLKNVKPEGNLFYDQMLQLQSTGKIEARVPVAKKKKYTPKITEKWTYKDFK